ncbi:4Fe-4S dicluster domain-containing protein [Candidatus Woesearchaeota archaeon]|nr:4Fe-4S dicluster domain-containing protein [Candidatus Woesearchaeota archaeon]
MGKLLKKEALAGFLEDLSQEYEIVAPVQRDILRFERIGDPAEICYDGLPMMPLKKYFMPPKEPLFDIVKGRLLERDAGPKRVIFGARLCDTNALLALDKLFLQDPADPFYEARRKNTVLVALSCTEPLSEWCFCESMGLADHYDLLLHDIGDAFHVEIGSDVGKRLVHRLPDHDLQVPRPSCSKRLERKDLKGFFEDRFWKEDADRCVSCQRCTILCPTCLCFDISDEMGTRIDIGTRDRQLDSCHSKDFTLVAGGHVFREPRLARFRHRIMHKLQYFPERFEGMMMCTGCGRCIEYCHSTIDFVTTINGLER